MPHFFGPVGSTASGAGKGLETCINKSYVQMEGKTVQLQHSRTEDIETVAGPKSSGHATKQWSCRKAVVMAQELWLFNIASTGFDDEEGLEAPTHTFDDDSEDDTAHPQQLLSFVGVA